ncbi:MAG: serine/threonine-protein kinase [Kofleriaceae bacterium]
MSTSTDIAVPVGARAGEYEIRDLLGRGGMGIVYAGVHPVIGKEVAIKVLDPRLATTAAVVERFEREARAVNTIRHPNIIDIFAFGHSPQLGYYFVMPRLRGENLGDRIANGPMTLAEALPIITEIVDALSAAHAAGVAHRDLKPDNIFLEIDRKGETRVQLLDFGIAKLLDAEAGSVTRSGTQMGTPLFMAPEQWDGAGIDHRADIYALGIIIHHVLTGRYPFESQSPLALMNMHGNAAPQLPSAHGGPPEVDSVIARALAKDKLLRYQSASEMLAALRACMQTVPASGTTATAHDTSDTLGALAASRPRRRIGVVIVAVGMSAAAAAGAIAIANRSATNDEASRPSASAGTAGVAVDGPAPLDATIAVSIDAAVATAPVVDAALVVHDAAPSRTVDARVRRSSVDASVPVAPRDATVQRRLPDSGWGSTVDPFSEGQP